MKKRPKLAPKRPKLGRAARGIVAARREATRTAADISAPKARMAARYERSEPRIARRKREKAAPWAAFLREAARPNENEEGRMKNEKLQANLSGN